MKIAVSSQGGSLSAQVAPNFGRCPVFLIIDSETMKFEFFTNPAEGMMGGAGPEAARQIHQHGAEVVLTGVVGPNAEKAIQTYGMKLVQRASGTVKEAIDKYLKEPK